MRVHNMESARTGRAIPNQFIVEADNGDLYFQSYHTIIAVKRNTGEFNSRREIVLDNDWDYSKTTGKYRNMFLGETRKETERKIKSGEYKIENLNK